MDTNLPGSGEPEYLGEGPTDPATPGGPTASGGDAPAPKRRRRTAVLAASGVAVAAVVGIGGWSLAQFLSGGDQPASAFPADTAAYMSVDLDPSAGQKIEAIKTLKKFPGLEKHMDLDARDDLRRYFFEKLAESGECKGIDYDKDIAPWIGDRLAAGAVPDGDKAVAVVALQAGDEDAARAAVKKLDACDDADEDSGVAFRNGYLLLSDSQEHVDLVAAGVDKGTLADDGDFQTWMDRAGDPGVVTAYAAAEAPQLLKSLDSDPPPMLGGAGGPSGADSVDQMLKLYKDFEGAAMVVRFEDGAFETEVVTKGLAVKGGGSVTAPSVADLPGSTALAVSLGLQKGWLTDYLDNFNEALGGGTTLDDAMRQGEQATGLQLPEDIETLLGDGVTLSVDGSIDMKALASSPDPTQVPVALRITGDPAKINGVLDKIKKAAGPQADVLQVRSGEGSVTVGLSPSYLDDVLGKGGLGSEATFDDVLPHGDAAGVFYLNFDAGDWATRLGDLVSDGDPEVAANIEPLDALGISGWADDDEVQHSLMRLTTD